MGARRAGLDGRGNAAPLVAERQGTVLCRSPTVPCCACRWRRAARRECRHADKKMLEGRYVSRQHLGGTIYDVSPNGQRFLMIKAPGTEASAAPALMRRATLG